MSNFIQITPNFAIAGQLVPEDFVRAAEAGYRTIINNRPDGEERGQLTATDGRQAAANHGLAYVHIPATKHDIFTDDVIGGMAQAIADHDGPILAHCKSGQRSAVVWAAASARAIPVADVLAALADAGLDLAFLRDELDKQAHRPHWAQANVAPRSSEGAAAEAAHAA